MQLSVMKHYYKILQLKFPSLILKYFDLFLTCLVIIIIQKLLFSSSSKKIITVSNSILYHVLMQTYIIIKSFKKALVSINVV